MKYELILENGKYALIKRGEHMDQYAVVNGLNKEDGSWAWTIRYIYFGKYSSLTEAQALSHMLEVFRYKTESNYISRFRLEKLAMLFKDRIADDAMEFNDSDEDFLEFFLDECEMDEKELGFFGIKTESEDE